MKHKGWIVRTALRLARESFEVDQPGGDEEGELKSPRTEMDMRAIIESRMNFVEWKDPAPTDPDEPGHFVWIFRQRRNGFFIGTHLRFFAPSISQIRQIHAAEVEQKRKAKAAKSERAELRRATFKTRAAPVEKVQATRQTSHRL